MPKKAKEMLLDIENDILYSTVSILETTIKHMLHPEKLRMNGGILEKGWEYDGYTVLPLCWCILWEKIWLFGTDDKWREYEKCWLQIREITEKDMRSITSRINGSKAKMQI